MSNTNSLQPIKRLPLLHEQVRQSLIDYILINELQPGEKLPPESELARRLSVSRASIRESVKSLEVVGIVRMERGNGIFVEEFSFDPLLDTLQYSFLFNLQQLRDLWEIRQILEIALIEESINLMSDERLEELREIVSLMRENANKGQLFPEQDRRFHQVSFEHLNNQVLLKLLDTFWLTFRKATQLASHITWEPDAMNTYQKHQDIVDAIAAKDIDGARAALKFHYDDLSEKLEEAQAKHDQKAD